LCQRQFGAFSLVVLFTLSCYKITAGFTKKAKGAIVFAIKMILKYPDISKDKKIWHFQLRIEQRGGRVFVGWNEGNIYFPPTYKYSNNSDKYAGDDMNQKEKRRTPAWYFSCRF